MDTKSVLPDNIAEKGKDGFKDVLNIAGKKINSIKNSGVASKLSVLPKSIKSSFSDGVKKKTNQTKEYIHSVKDKNLRMKNLEKLLYIDEDNIMASSKKNVIYGSNSGKLTIIDKDYFEEPVLVTIKDENSAIIKKIKFYNDKPFLFPNFDEKHIKGEVYNVEENEIWYNDNDTFNVLIFKGDKIESLKVKIDKSKHRNRDEIIDYVRMNVNIQINKRISSLLKTKDIESKNVIKIGKNYLLAKVEEGFAAYFSDESGELNETGLLKKIPRLSDSGFEAMFSHEISSFALKSGYLLDEFIQNGEYIEYWHEIGSKKVCLMRYKC